MEVDDILFLWRKVQVIKTFLILQKHNHYPLKTIINHSYMSNDLLFENHIVEIILLFFHHPFKNLIVEGCIQNFYQTPLHCSTNCLPRFIFQKKKEHKVCFDFFIDHAIFNSD